MFVSTGTCLHTPEMWPQLPLYQDPPQAMDNDQNFTYLSDTSIL